MFIQARHCIVLRLRQCAHGPCGTTGRGIVVGTGGVRAGAVAGVGAEAGADAEVGTGVGTGGGVIAFRKSNVTTVTN